MGGIMSIFSTPSESRASTPGSCLSVLTVAFFISIDMLNCSFGQPAPSCSPWASSRTASADIQWDSSLLSEIAVLLLVVLFVPVGLVIALGSRLKRLVIGT